MASQSPTTISGTATTDASIEVWQISLEAPAPVIEQARACLSPDALARAALFHNPDTQRRHLLAHAALRRLLADKLNCAPQAITFALGPHGKPMVPSAPIHFNLSHSGELALVALCEHAEVGVDIERIRPVSNVLALAKRFFTPGEYAELSSLGPAAQPDGFFKLWTQKEALLKATGLGIANGLKRFEVTNRNGGGLVQVDGTPANSSAWTLFNWEPCAGHVSACAVPVQNARVAVNQFSLAKI
jgi:4'-phosphopantetheinyl transferase